MRAFPAPIYIIAEIRLPELACLGKEIADAAWNAIHAAVEAGDESELGRLGLQVASAAAWICRLDLQFEAAFGRKYRDESSWTSAEPRE